MPRLITDAPQGILAILDRDIDGDGDTDILSASYVDGQIAWHENRPIGDSNRDGQFNSSDLVRAFQAGEYEDLLPRNSTFDEGDWNRDGDFNSSDLVYAFQLGTYTVAAVVRDVITKKVAEQKGIGPPPMEIHARDVHAGIAPGRSSNDRAQHLA